MKAAVQDLGETKGRITVKVKVVVLSFLRRRRRRRRRSWLDWSDLIPVSRIDHDVFSSKTFLLSCKIYTLYKARKRKVVPGTIWVGRLCGRSGSRRWFDAGRVVAP